MIDVELRIKTLQHDRARLHFLEALERYEPRTTSVWSETPIRAQGVHTDSTAKCALLNIEAAERGGSAEVQALRQRIAITEVLLDALNERQRFVIEGRYIENQTWDEIRTAYTERFGCGFSSNTIKRVFQSGLDLLKSITA